MVLNLDSVLILSSELKKQNQTPHMFQFSYPEALKLVIVLLL